MGNDRDEARREEAVRRLLGARNAEGHAAEPESAGSRPTADPRPNVLSTDVLPAASKEGRGSWGSLGTRFGGPDAPIWTTALIVAATGLWVVAQALPAFAIVPDDFLCSAWPRWDPPATCDLPGIVPTLFGWLMFVEDAYSAIAWSTNGLLVLAVALRFAGRPVGATVCALGAVVCALLAIAVLEGVVGEAVEGLALRGIRIGTLVWVASTVLMLGGIVGWAFATRPRVVEAGRGRISSLAAPVALGFAALVVAGSLTVAFVTPSLERALSTPGPGPAPTPVPGTVQVTSRQLPRVVSFEGGTYRVEACAGDQVLLDGEPRGTPPLELVVPAGAHEVDGELRRCDVTFIPIDP